jgi:SAM-dependent methyltransferase
MISPTKTTRTCCSIGKDLPLQKCLQWERILTILLFGWTLSYQEIRVQAFSTIPPSLNTRRQHDALSSTREKASKEPTPDVPRRDVFGLPFLAVGSAVITGELLAASVSGLSLSRPAAHEQRVMDTIRRTLVDAAASASTPIMRVLEVGIGADCRLIRRGLYNQAIEKLATSKGPIKQLQITGIDLQIPKDNTVQDAQILLDQLGQDTGVQSTLKVHEASITTRLPFPDGAFDAVICCLTLCSVDEPDAAVEEMKRLIRATGGAFGYVEHVAVNPDEPYRWLEWQQETLDPLQQLVADNCHLHRYTQQTIHDVFATGDTSAILHEERFLVDRMWPVTSQSCGVIRRQG